MAVVVLAIGIMESFAVVFIFAVIRMTFLVVESGPVDFAPPITPLNFIPRLLLTLTQLRSGHLHPVVAVDSG